MTESTIGASFSQKVVTVSSHAKDAMIFSEETKDNKPDSLTQADASVRLQIWDTAGEEKFRSITPMYYKNASAIILVYDITNLQTFQALGKWVEEIDKNLNREDIVLALVANKIDMPQNEEVPLKDGLEYAQKLGSIFVQASAKTNEGIEMLFK